MEKGLSLGVNVPASASTKPLRTPEQPTLKDERHNREVKQEYLCNTHTYNRDFHQLRVIQMA